MKILFIVILGLLLLAIIKKINKKEFPSDDN
jgi:hypothetical protein